MGEDSEGESGPQRRVRTKFTSEQISSLEKTFSKHKYLGATQRRKIAEKLRLSETQVYMRGADMFFCNSCDILFYNHCILTMHLTELMQDIT